MKTRMIAFVGVLALVGVAAASVNFNQTFTNRTSAAAGGFNWWFTPDSTSSSVGSNVFTANTTTHYNPVGTHGYTTTAKIHYSGGNVGASASMWATLSNNSTISYRPEWTTTGGVVIGSANLPCSFGGAYNVGIGDDRYWTVRIDNPSDDMVMLIDNLRSTTATVELYGPSLGGYAGPWQTVGPGMFSVPAGAELSFDVPVSGRDEFPVVDCDLSYDDVPDSGLELQFQVTPEPACLALLFGGALPLVLKRRRKKQ